MSSVGVNKNMGFITPIKRKKRVESTHKIGLGHKHCHRFIVLGHHCGWRDVKTFSLIFLSFEPLLADMFHINRSKRG